MNVERFTIPEILFRPSIIGIDQAGIAESIYNAVEQLPERRPKLMQTTDEDRAVRFRHSTEFVFEYLTYRWQLSISEFQRTSVSRVGMMGSFNEEMTLLGRMKCDR